MSNERAGQCRLCKEHSDLCESHVIPAFVYAWMRESSVGHMRSSANPNVRIQDGPKFYWLCRSCEQRLGKWEKRFAEVVFRYVHATSADQRPCSYGPWALKFACSVSWRVLLYFQDKGFTRLSEHQISLVTKAEATWREFLLGKRPHPGAFEQHVLPVDVIDSHSGTKLSPSINRYLIRAVDADLVSCPTEAFVYSKLCRLMIFGFIQQEKPRWSGTKLNARSGKIGSSKYEMSGKLLNFWNGKADTIAQQITSLSPRQKQKVQAVYN